MINFGSLEKTKKFGEYGEDQEYSHKTRSRGGFRNRLYRKKKQQSWWGHLNRMGDIRPMKQIWQAKMFKGKTAEMKAWRKAIGKVLLKRRNNWNEAKIIEKNKKKWN